MKISYKWLCELLPGLNQINPIELAHQLTMSGLEVESILDFGKKFSGIVVGEVIKKDKHPGADKLSVCEVSTGEQKFQVVCGAPNVQAGHKYPFATLGTVMPSGLGIKPVKLRGVESFGMLCSAKELELEHPEDGLLELPTLSVPGSPVHVAVGLDDVVFELNVTPNRGDALSHWGVVRDIAALTGLKPKLDILVPQASGQNFNPAPKCAAEGPEVDLKISLDASQACPRYTGSQIFGVKVGPSPCWLARRLVSLGVRSINNVVDATNYIMLLTGHPVHAFDATTVAGHHIKIQQIPSAQKFKTLDGVERELLAGDLVIADGSGPVALAGIMGGENSEVKDSTQDLILEVAHFDAAQIAKTSRRLGLQTESSYRFARAVNPDSVFEAHVLLRDLILALAGGRGAEIQDLYPKPFKPVQLVLKSAEIRRLLGMDVHQDDVLRVLGGLNCEVEVRSDGFHVSVPLSRSDLTRPVDLIEEIARILGLDRIPSVMPMLNLRSTVESDGSRSENKIKSYFAAQGFSETIHYSFSEAQFLKTVFPESHAGLGLKNPISEDLKIMRPSLLPSLLQCYKKNHLKQEQGLRLFECRTVYPVDAEGNVAEVKRLAGLYGGPVWGRNRFGLKREHDFFDGLGILNAFFRDAGLSLHPVRHEAWPFHPGQSVIFKKQDDELARFGGLHPELLQTLKITQNLFYFEIKFDLLAKSYQHTPVRYAPFGELPPVYRDLAIIVAQELSCEDVLKTIAQEKPACLKSVELFDLYAGEQVPEGKKSMAFSFTYEPDAENLTDEAVNAMHFALVERLGQRLNVVLR